MTTIKQQAQAALTEWYKLKSWQSSAAWGDYLTDYNEAIHTALTLLARDDVAIVPKAATKEMIVAYGDRSRSSRGNLGEVTTSHAEDQALNAWDAFLSAAPDVMEMGDMPNLCNPKNNGE